jgi:hypothetical protein
MLNPGSASKKSKTYEILKQVQDDKLRFFMRPSIITSKKEDI